MGFKHISRLWALCLLIPGILGLMMQVSPQDAASNVSKWITSAGYTPPDFLLPQSVDITVRYISFGLIIFGSLWLLWPVIVAMNQGKWRLWFGVENKADSKWMPIHEAIDQIQADIVLRKTTDDPFNELRQAAASEEVELRGKRERSLFGYADISTKVPSDYWERMKFREVAIMDEMARNEAQTEIANSGDLYSTIPKYYYLEVNRNQLDSKWPKRKKNFYGKIPKSNF